MSVIGIDFGNESCHIAAVRDGGIEIITNDTGQRMTPSYVAFGEQNRSFGSQAKSAHVTNVKNTIFGFKRLIGRKINDPFIQNESSYLSYPICESQHGFIGIKVSYRKEIVIFSVQQMVAMLLAKLKETAEAVLGTEVTSCVLSVPSYFSNDARLAMLDAASVAKLNVIKLMNDPTSVALSYGFYKQDLPENKPITVVFVDLGHSALQVSACLISKGKVKVLATATNVEVGGRDFDNLIVRHFAKEFQAKYHINVLSNYRAIIRLSNECEKLKKQLSANPQSLPLNIDCLMDDVDVRGCLDRKEMEELCGELLVKAKLTLKKLLVEANLTPRDINSVELVGGSSRIPAMKQIVQQVFGCEPSTTLNLDEAVAKGCALQCAILSPSLKVREFSVTDVLMYPIKLMWFISKGNQGEIEVFPAKHEVPFSKYLTFFQTDEFTIQASDCAAHEKFTSLNNIGSFTIRNITRSSSGESAKVRLKVRVNIHGIFCITSAVELSKGADDTEPINQKEEDFIDVNGSNVLSKSQENDKKSPKKQKKPIKSVELPIDCKVSRLKPDELSKYVEEEMKMTQMDKFEKERIDAKNAFEEYVYELRCSLGTELEPFVSKQESQNLMQRLERTENWLYEDGKDCKTEIFSEMHAELKDLAEPILSRKWEYEQRCDVIDSFRNVIQHATKIIDMFRAGDPDLSYLNPSDVDQVKKIVDDKKEWLDKQILILSEANLQENPPVLLKTILEEKVSLSDKINPILNQPKP